MSSVLSGDGIALQIRCSLAPLVSCLVWLAVASGMTQETTPSAPPRASSDWRDTLTRETWQSPAGEELPYRKLTPAWVEPGEKYPLVVFLHGAGERGDDNQRQLVHGVQRFVERREQFPCFLIAPQCPADQWWATLKRGEAERRLAAEPESSLRAVHELVEHALQKWPIDPDRVYLTGLSMGGFGSWDALARWPEVWAAAAPVCGGGDASPENLARFVHIPVWVCHGSADEVVPVATSRAMVEGLRKAGGKPHYVELAGVGHDSWSAMYRDEKFFEWLFAQRRPTSR